MNLCDMASYESFRKVLTLFVLYKSVFQGKALITTHFLSFKCNQIVLSLSTKKVIVGLWAEGLGVHHVPSCCRGIGYLVILDEKIIGLGAGGLGVHVMLQEHRVSCHSRQKNHHRPCWRAGSPPCPIMLQGPRVLEFAAKS